MARNISCQDAMSKLQAYLDNELGGPTEEDIEQHIANCRECFSRAEFEKSLRKRVESTASMPTPDAVKDRLASLIKKF